MGALDSADYGYLRDVVQRRSQNVLDSECDYLFETRLAALLRQQGMNQLKDLVSRLRFTNDPELECALAAAMTIKETSFFRDSRTFELLRKELVPALVGARRPCRALRFWSAACSTGQEAYSLAILLREHFGSDTEWSLRIDGTDIAYDAIERARRGVFHRIEMNRGLETHHIARHFHQAGEEWGVNPGVRALCHFRPANICQVPLPFREQFDVILLRNVMLYFAQETRRTLLENVHRLLAPDGILLLGAAEQPPEISLWRACFGGGACYYRPR